VPFYRHASLATDAMARANYMRTLSNCATRCVELRLRKMTMNTW
jgi:hypothetical protein